MKKIMIVAGEASGDMHGANLVKAMKSLDNDLSFYGVGDKELKAAGIEVLLESRQISVVGLVEIFFHLTEIRKAYKKLVHHLSEDRPALLILIDFPEFNLMLAKQAKKQGIPVFYYISPQVWAWRKGRVKKIARLVDKLVVILPFEKDFYAEQGYDIAEFVGHPLVDSVRVSEEVNSFRITNNISENSTIVGILPGSRKREITSILPEFLDAAKKLALQKKNICFVMPLAPTLHESDLQIDQGVKDEINLKIIKENRYDLMANCDLVMVASGTVTLELALLKVPMVVVYRIAPPTYWVAKMLITIKYASLVNLIAGKEVVKELLQSDFTSKNLVDSLIDIWPGTTKYKEIKAELEKIRNKVGPAGASRRAAEKALKLIIQ